MGRFIPNENTWLAFATTCANILHPTLAEIAAAVDLTHYLMSVNASSTGNTVPTPSLDTLFETSIAGTVQAAFSMDMYRDDDVDTAWVTLPRKTRGFVFLSRFGGGSTVVNGRPITADKLEVWPVLVVSRANGNTTNNTVQTFTSTCSIPNEPAEDATVVAA